MSTTTIIILNGGLIAAIVFAITGLLFHAIRTSPATERAHRRARRVERRTPGARQAPRIVWVPAARRD